ncbi:MAG: DUF523 domain-containing protein [Candidatus Bathyarchaeota archaeon]|nr:DUF523 domain-containing protein [Candidatus Bathyarchaeota archaeon]
MRIVSACLLGVKCNFEGKNWKNPKLLEEFLSGDLFPVCPEVMGGLSVPRVPAEIQGGSGLAVLKGKAKVVNEKGVDVTDEFVKGAFEVLRLAKLVGAKEALLTEKSPSCGCGETYDGSFSNRTVEGDGVACALLKTNGIHVTCVKTSKM